MQRAILFHYHAYPDICENRIELLRRLNPGIPVYGMYGGEGEAPPLKLDHQYTLPFTDARFKADNGDLCARRWYRDAGHRLPFDMLNLVQWDLVFMKPLAAIYAHVTDGVGAVHVESVDTKRANGWPWVTREPGLTKLPKLQAYLREKYDFDLPEDRQLTCDFPGACMSRAFLHRYAEDEIPVLLHDEVRMTFFAQAFGMPVHNVPLISVYEHWNCSKSYIPPDVIYAARHIRSAFHPVKEWLNLDLL